MICFVCFRAVTKADWSGHYEWRVLDGETMDTVFGKGEQPLPKIPPGYLTKVSHGKCYHVWKRQQGLAEAKAADPSANQPPPQEWRHQEVVDVETLSEGHGADRGAGPSGS